MTSTQDRRVHARGEGGSGRVYEVVRYDRSGRWSVEHRGGSRRVTFAAAVELAQEIARAGDGKVFFGLLGGSRFDKAMEDYRPPLGALR